MIIYLGLPLLTTSCNLPEHTNGTRRPFALLGLAPDGVCLAGDITTATGGLLHHRFTLTRLRRQYTSLLHFPAGHPARPLAGVVRCGVRTFLTLPTRDKARSSSQLEKGMVMVMGKDGKGLGNENGRSDTFW